MQSGLLPLFPLPVVVFPRTPLPLHIFEERYKEMVGEAIRDKTEFGMVLSKDEGFASIGCTVGVDDVVKRYGDGQLDILASGRRRFEIVMLNQEKSFLRAEVEYFDDNESAEVPRELHTLALREYGRLLRLIRDKPRPFDDPKLDDPQLSFQLGHMVQDLEFRQLLLQSRSESARLRQLADYLIDYVPKE
ncbi:MAG: hypothetical protein EXQ52_09205, partial [Bryobacterales bacterium]|nr:hypothetical protein [Bryobacterales bacterium]